MAFDFAFEQALDEFGEAALLTLCKGLGGFFHFGMQGYVCFFSHTPVYNIDFKIRAILFF